MQVIVLAGGKGTRLRPFTFSLPKPLVPIGEHPILDIILQQLHRAGASEVILSTGYLGELLEAYCGDGKKWGLSIRYAREKTPLNTAGALRLIEGLEENFLVMNGDILTSLNYQTLWADHLKSGASATAAVCERTMNVDFGVVEMDSSGTLKEYKEKPQLAYAVSMGINVLKRECCDLIKPQEALSMPDLLLRLKAVGKKIHCYRTSDAWLDIGRPADYELAQETFEKSKSLYLPNA